MGRRACGSSGGGCQFLGTAATSQVIAEALGLALPHSALAPSGEPVWLELASRSATALHRLHLLGVSIGQILTAAAIENAMLLHAAFGGSTNLLLHVPAIAAAAGLKPPAVEDWIRVNRATRRLVDALPNGPHGFATVQVFMAGGVPEVMLHLRRMGPAERARAHGDRRHARRHARLVGIERAAPGGAHGSHPPRKSIRIRSSWRPTRHAAQG
jgi:dihydroxyacid dehydratase/phosphogluconate dehydratase